ncbi:MAG TPA: hypothetical protein VG015_00410 [Candidatus Dormibacteraeota bacterium]|nr:hypothetical protein [Candidatus Dormibacteraeota bacterium]
MATVSTIVASSVVTKETVLETTDGLTLYYFVKGDTGKTTPQCTGTCASTWIPYTLATGTPTGTSDLTASSLGTVTNTDKNAPQVTYKGWPLYTYVKDFGPGDATGNGVGGGSWLAATPDMPQHM